MKLGTRSLAVAVSLAVAITADAHHSASAFDVTTEVTVEGTISELEWKNPHIYFKIRTTGPDGRTRLQEVEVGPISAVQTYGITRDVLAPGSNIVLRANPSRRGPDGTLRGLDVTTSDGTILPLVIAGRSNAPPATTEAADSLESRWSASRQALQSAARAMADWPFTAAGNAALAAVRAGEIAAQAVCPEYAPPMLDDFPALREIEIGEERILIRFDTGGVETVRTIHLDQSAHPADVEPSLLGHSIGRWDGEALLVDTVAFTPDRRGVALIGVPSGPGKHLVERFVLAEDGRSLRRETRLEDPDFLTAPVSWVMVWEHRPDLEFSSASVPCDPEVAERFLEDL